jgi:hypothetical protein
MVDEILICYCRFQLVLILHTKVRDEIAIRLVKYCHRLKIYESFETRGQWSVNQIVVCQDLSSPLIGRS